MKAALFLYIYWFCPFIAFKHPSSNENKAKWKSESVTDQRMKQQMDFRGKR